FLNRYLPTRPGPVRTPDGRVIGQHHGLAFYTLGQRKGLGIGGVKGLQRSDGTAAAWYAARKDMATYTLYVLQGHDHPWLISRQFKAADASWIAGSPPEPTRYAAKTRYRQADAVCVLTDIGEGTFTLRFTDPQWA